MTSEKVIKEQFDTIDRQTRTIYEQVDNIGSEIGRALKWQTTDQAKAETAAKEGFRANQPNSC